MTHTKRTEALQGFTAIAQRSAVLSRLIPDIAQRSAKHIEHSAMYPRISLISDFTSYDIIEMAKPDFDIHGRFEWFPWAEIANNLSNSLSLIMMGMHESAIDSQRRALELSVIASYLSAANTSKAAARRWMHSEMCTPQFSIAVHKLASHGFPEKFNEIGKWELELNKYYHDLCDPVHTKRRKHKDGKENARAGSYNGMSVLRFDGNLLDISCERFIQSAGFVALVCALANPISLFGIPLEEKFGIHQPVSGFLKEPQAARLREIIPAQFKSSLIQCASQDEGCKTALEWVNSLPDFAMDEMKHQPNDFELLDEQTIEGWNGVFDSEA